MLSVIHQVSAATDAIDHDVGNTIRCWAFSGELIADGVTTARLQTVDEYGVLGATSSRLPDSTAPRSGVIISSVVPPMNWTFAEISGFVRTEALFVELGVKTGMAVSSTIPWKSAPTAS